MIEIDGAFGEGGGQIIRTSLSLSAITGEPVHIRNVRANRSKPGLLRQHLTALNAVAEICGGKTTGAELGSREITLTPGSIRAGKYEFSVGSAGSANLVLQTALPVLLSVHGVSELRVHGGTHNSSSPPYPFLEECFFPALREIGHGVTGELVRYGFYPAGGGEIAIRVEGGSAPKSINWLNREAEISLSAEAIVSNIGNDVAKRELNTIAKELNLNFDEACRFNYPEAQGPGNALLGRLAFGERIVMFAEFGERGVSAEQVAKRVVKQMKAFMASGAVVDHHLADQLLLPLALGRGGVFSTTRPSLHTTTNAEVISKFTGKTINLVPDDTRTVCEVS